MNVIRVQAVINKQFLSNTTWGKATGLADSIKEACADNYNKDFDFRVTLQGIQKTQLVDNVSTAERQTLVDAEIKFEAGTWSDMQTLEKSINTACGKYCSIAGNSNYKIQSYIGQEVNP